MKIVNYSTGVDAPTTGVVQGDDAVDLGSCGFPTDMQALLGAGIDVTAIEAALAGGRHTPLSQVAVHAPLSSPGKVLAIGLNYGERSRVVSGDRQILQTCPPRACR